MKTTGIECFCLLPLFWIRSCTAVESRMAAVHDSFTTFAFNRKQQCTRFCCSRWCWSDLESHRRLFLAAALHSPTWAWQATPWRHAQGRQSSCLRPVQVRYLRRFSLFFVNIISRLLLFIVIAKFPPKLLALFCFLLFFSCRWPESSSCFCRKTTTAGWVNLCQRHVLFHSVRKMTKKRVEQTWGKLKQNRENFLIFTK